MTKKDYLKFVKLINDMWRVLESESLHPEAKYFLDLITEGVIHIFKQDNPKFSEKKFREAIK